MSDGRGWFHVEFWGYCPDPDDTEKAFDAFTDTIVDAGGDVETAGGTLNATEAEWQRDMGEAFPEPTWWQRVRAYMKASAS